MYTTPNHPLRILANGFMLATKLPTGDGMVFDLSETPKPRKSMAARFNEKIQAFLRDQEADEAARHLLVMDDRMLGDIGISRGEIAAAVHGGRAVLAR